MLLKQEIPERVKNDGTLAAVTNNVYHSMLKFTGSRLVALVRGSFVLQLNAL